MMNTTNSAAAMDTTHSRSSFFQCVFGFSSPPCAALVLAVRAFVFGVVRVEGSSMAGTLNSGDLAIVTRFDYRLGRPHRGDVVLCRFPQRDGAYLKRLIGLPGETVEIIDSRVYIDGVPLSEPYATGASEDYRIELGEDEYLVLGDNRAESYDSRAEEIGTLQRKDLLGRVRLVLWPFRIIE